MDLTKPKLNQSSSSSKFATHKHHHSPEVKVNDESTVSTVNEHERCSQLSSITTTSVDGAKKRRPMCARCRNHGVKQEVKGKLFCVKSNGPSVTIGRLLHLACLFHLPLNLFFCFLGRSQALLQVEGL